jgi:hypothetical protein
MEIDIDAYLGKIRQRRSKAGLPRNERDEMLDLFVARLNVDNVRDGYPRASHPRVAKMLEGIPTGDLHAIYKKCSTARKFGALLRYELKPRTVDRQQAAH